MRKSTKYLVLWILFFVPLSFSVLALLATLAYAEDAATRSLVSAVWSVCIVAFAAPEIAFFLIWSRHHKRDLELEAVGALLRAYPSVPLSHVAQRLDRTEAEIEALVTDAIAGGFAKGFIEYRDRTFHNTALGIARPPPSGPPVEGEAASSPGLRPAAQPRFCRKCGNRVYPVDGSDLSRCWNCGNEQTLEP